MTRSFVQTTMLEKLKALTSKQGAKLDPCEHTITPFPYIWWRALMGTKSVQISAESDVVEVILFKTDEEAQDFFGSLGFPAPNSKEPYAINTIFVPPPPITLTTGQTIKPRCARKATTNLAKYDRESSTLYFRVSVVRTNGMPSHLAQAPRTSHLAQAPRRFRPC